MEVPVIDEPVTVIFSKNGWVRVRQGWQVDPAGLSFKEGDSLQALILCRTVDPVIFLDSNGRAYTVQAGELPPARGDGAPASSLVDLQEGGRIVQCAGGRPETRLLVASSGGYGFLCTIADMVSNRRAGREFMSVEAGEVPLAPAVYAEARGNYVAAVAEQGRLLTFDIAEMRQMTRGRGVIVMGLEKDEKLIAVAVTNEKELIVAGVGRGGKEKEVRLAGEKLAHHFGHRARMGRVLPDKLKPRALKLRAQSDPSAAGR